MKMMEKVGSVKVMGNLAPTQFTIMASRKAFEILSSTLYADKCRAIIRELSTNANDAHVSAGKPDVPFVVHLPNQFEPWFSVTDYGTGLSDEQIIGEMVLIEMPNGDVVEQWKPGIYQTYFDSDKTSSNDLTGCLGLGSKSPFAYTDTFSVESRYNGVKRLYSAYLDEGRMPAITKMSEAPTDEPNGMTIQFPVKSGDFYEFREKAGVVLQWFKVKPTITGVKDFEYPEQKYLRKTDSYAVYEAKQYGYDSRSYVIMGNVAYPFDAREFLEKNDPDYSKLIALAEWGCELYVNLGDVDITPSREKLSYDKRTKRNLRAALSAALADLEVEVTKEIANAPTLWAARQQLYKVHNSFKGFDFKAEWGGNPIMDHAMKTYKDVESVDEKGKTHIIKRPSAEIEIWKVKTQTADRLVVSKDRQDKIHANDMVIFLCDERGASAAIRRYLRDKDYYTKVYVISEYDPAWVEETGLSSIVVKTSTLPKPERAKGEKGSSQKAKVYEYVPEGNNYANGRGAGNYWKPAEIEVDDGGVYVEILYFSYRMKAGEATQSPDNLQSPLNLLEALGKGVKLYGIRPSDKALLDNSEGEWLNLKDYAKRVVKDLEGTYLEDVKRTKDLEGCFNVYGRNPSVPYEAFAKHKLSQDSLFGQFVTRILECKKAYQNQQAKTYHSLCHWCGEIQDLNISTLFDLKGEVMKRYPLLEYCRSAYNDYTDDKDFQKHALEYIKLIDAQEAEQAEEAAA